MSRSRRGLRLAVLAGLAAVVAVAAVVKVGPATFVALGRGILALATAPPRPADPPAPPVTAPIVSNVAYDALADMPDELRAALTGADTNGQPFRFLLAVPPADICDAMEGQGLPTAGWVQLGEDWECASDLAPLPGSAPPPETAAQGVDAEWRPSTMFFVARGPSEDRVGTIRFKLNLDDPSVDAAGREALLDALARLSGPLAWSIPKEVETAIRRHRKLSTFDRGIAVEVHPEMDPVLRLNVVLLLETPAARLPTDRFERLPPGVAERLAQ